MIRDVAKEHGAQIVLRFGVTEGPQLWSDAERSMDGRQILRSHVTSTEHGRMKAATEPVGYLSQNGNLSGVLFCFCILRFIELLIM